MQKITDIQVGHSFLSPIHGKGMITAKTKRTLTAVFESGVTVKLTYRYADAYFYGSDFK